MDAKEFFSKLSGQVAFHFRKKTSTKNRGSSSSDDEEDVMDGDFVLLGDTQEEMNCSYQQEISSVNGLPTYSTVMREPYQKQPPPPSQSPAPSSTSAGPPANPGCDDTASPVSDVPYQFHPNLRVGWQLRTIFDGLDLQPQSFDSAKYSYDFNQERLCLRELD